MAMVSGRVLACSLMAGWMSKALPTLLLLAASCCCCCWPAKGVVLGTRGACDPVQSLP